MIILSQVRNCGARRGSAVCVFWLLVELVIAEFALADGSIEIFGSADDLSIQASAVTLREVLQELSDQNIISVESTAPFDEQIQIERKRVSADVLVRHLLRQYSFLMIAEPGSPIRIKVTAPGQHAALTLRRDERFANFDSAIAELSNPDPDAREEALLTLSDIGDHAAVPYIRSMLADEVPFVREVAEATLEDLTSMDDSK